MTIEQSAHQADESREFVGDALECTNCHTDTHLIVESIHPLGRRTVGLVSIEYSCGNCEAFFAHEARVESVAKLLGKSQSSTGILNFGRYYIHCGEPMLPGPLKLATLNVTDGDLVNSPGVEIPTTVLRCRCGFQMAMPTH